MTSGKAMKTYRTRPKDIPLVDAYDVIVAGGGPAGSTAAIAAAREGTRTLLLEATSALGGLGTSGLVPAWCPFSDRKQIIYGGLATADYVLTLDDYLARRSFPDEICRNNYPIDIHTAKNEQEKAKQGGFHVMDRYEKFKDGESHGIPYRCLTPKGIANVLVAGRAISCDRPVQGSVRVMPPCLCMGEAAEVAAAMARRSGNDVHAIDTDVLRDTLRAHGAYLPCQIKRAASGMPRTPGTWSCHSC